MRPAARHYARALLVVAAGALALAAVTVGLHWLGGVAGPVWQQHAGILAPRNAPERWVCGLATVVVVALPALVWAFGVAPLAARYARREEGA